MNPTTAPLGSAALNGSPGRSLTTEYVLFPQTYLWKKGDASCFTLASSQTENASVHR
jgi:hypothetical protein